MSNWTEKGYDVYEHGWHRGWDDNRPNGGYPDKYVFADTIRSLCIGFGNFFSNIHVIRYNANGIPVKTIQVPLKFGPRSKAYDFRKEQESGKKYYIQMPNLTYRITGYTFSPERASGSNETRSFYSDYLESQGLDYVISNQFWQDYQPVPYNITFEMEAKTEYISDANQIVEQVLSRFAPEAFFDVKEFWFLNKRRSIKIKLESSNVDITQDFEDETKREITASFQFVVEAVFYKQINDSYIIDKILTTLNAKNTKYLVVETAGNINQGDGKEFINRYDFEEKFGVKIGHVSAMKIKEGYPKFISNSALVTEYEYEEKDDITNYPYSYKHLTAVSSYLDPTNKTWHNEYGYDNNLSGWGNLNPSTRIILDYSSTVLSDDKIYSNPYYIQSSAQNDI